MKRKASDAAPLTKQRAQFGFIGFALSWKVLYWKRFTQTA